jgi:hypothetical protein
VWAISKKVEIAVEETFGSDVYTVITNATMMKAMQEDAV